MLWFAFKLYLCTADKVAEKSVRLLWFAFKLYLCTADVRIVYPFICCGLLSNCIFAQLSEELIQGGGSCGLLSNCIFAQQLRITESVSIVVVCFQIVSLHSNLSSLMTYSPVVVCFQIVSLHSF